MPKLPIVLDSCKGQILTYLKEEKKKLKAIEDAKSEEEKKAEETKKGKRMDLFEMLSKQDEQVLDLFAPEQVVKKKAPNNSNPIPDVVEMCSAIVLSKMGLHAQEMSYRVKELGEKRLVGEEMLEYYKPPFAVYLNKSYFILIRQTLEE